MMEEARGPPADDESTQTAPKPDTASAQHAACLRATTQAEGIAAGMEGLRMKAQWRRAGKSEMGR